MSLFFILLEIEVGKELFLCKVEEFFYAVVHIPKAILQQGKDRELVVVVVVVVVVWALGESSFTYFASGGSGLCVWLCLAYIGLNKKEGERMQYKRRASSDVNCTAVYAYVKERGPFLPPSV